MLDIFVRLCYTNNVKRERKIPNTRKETRMYGVTGYECYEGENEIMWFDTMDEMMEWLEMFEIFDLSEMTEIRKNLWTMGE